MPGPFASRATLAGALLLATALLALPAPSASARGRSSGPRPAKAGALVAAMVNVHNGFANLVNDEFVGSSSTYAIELEHCHAVEAASGEARAAEEPGLRESAKVLADKVDTDYKPFNSSVLEWIGELKPYARGLSKPARKQLQKAFGELNEAHDAHEHEFFAIRGVWVAMESVGCAAAEAAEQEAATTGTHAWVQEYKGLLSLSRIFHAAHTRIEYSFGPYLG